MKLHGERKRKSGERAVDLVRETVASGTMFEPLTDLPEQVWSEEVNNLIADSIHSNDRQGFNFSVLGDLCWINPEMRTKIFQNTEFATAWEEYVKRSIERVLTYEVDPKLIFFGSSFARWTYLDPTVRRFFPQLSPDDVAGLLDAWEKKFQRNLGALFTDLSLLVGLQQSFPYTQPPIRKLLDRSDIKQQVELRIKKAGTGSDLFNRVQAGLLYPEDAERFKALMPQDQLEQHIRSVKEILPGHYGLFVPLTLFFSQKAWIDDEGTLRRIGRPKALHRKPDLPQRPLVA